MMNRLSGFGVTSFALLLAASTAPSCGGSANSALGGGGGMGSADDGGGTSSGSDDASGSGASSGGGISTGFTDPATTTTGDGGSCPSGLTCNVKCASGATTSISGTVYDPAGRDPLYDIVVYVPQGSLQPLPKGVPTGADACSCPALYKSGEVVTTTTGVNGTFKLEDAPVGDSVPLVIQVGKWRRLFHVKTTACENTAVADKTLLLPSTVAAGDTNDNIPDIAVSTGSADTLECLMLRIGLSTTEYVAGAGGTGHVHVFAGGDAGGRGIGGGVGTAEAPGMAGAPASPTNLWASQSQLMPYDVVLLSCEGGETYDANPPALEAYLNAGGRAFGSHYHYAWFSGPIGSRQAYAAPSDWGTNLATWTANGNGTGGGGFLTGGTPIGGSIVTTLNGSTQTFAKGEALDQWLGVVGALGQNGVGAGLLSIYQPRYNAQVGPANKPSQPWITYDDSGTNWTMYFSFDTPVGGVQSDAGSGETAPTYCGRAVFSDLHVAGNPMTTDTMSPPGGCFTGDLSPQEKALEFMLFDLSSCVIPDTVPPSTAGPIPQ